MALECWRKDWSLQLEEQVQGSAGPWTQWFWPRGELIPEDLLWNKLFNALSLNKPEPYYMTNMRGGYMWVCVREREREKANLNAVTFFLLSSKSLSLCYTWMNYNSILWNFDVFFFFFYFKNQCYRGKIYNKEATILTVQIHECSLMSLFPWPKLFCHAPSFFLSFLKYSSVCWPPHSPSSCSSYRQKMIIRSSFSQLCLLVSLIRL